MARTDNFEHFLTDVADAIREKTGGTHKISPASYDVLIRSILPIENTPDDSVRFIDYDGTLIHSFKKHDFLMRLDMPELPEHLGLVNTGWNWSFEAARQQVVLNGHLDIGCQYYTADNTLRMVLDIPEDNFEITFDHVYNFSSDLEYDNVGIDWGDGTFEKGPFYYKENTYKNENAGHMYTKAGRYTVVFQRLNDPNTYVGDYETFYVNGFSNPELVKEIYYPRCPRSSSGRGEFWDIDIRDCENLEILVYDPETINTTYYENTCPLSGSQYLKHLVATSYDVINQAFEGWAYANYIPVSQLRPEYVELAEELGPWTDSETGEEISDLYLTTQALQSVSYPQITENNSYESIICMNEHSYVNMRYIRPPYHSSINTIPAWRYGYIEDVQTMLDNMPKSMTTIGGYFLNNSITQFSQTIRIPEGITTIEHNFMGDIVLYKGAVITVRMPSTITNINVAFASYEAYDDPDDEYWGDEAIKYGYLHIDFSQAKQVPVLADYESWMIGSGYEYVANKFITIIVPDELYDEWIVATNWATYYKDRIVKASEYVAPTES